MMAARHPCAPPGSTSRGSEQTRQKGSRRSRQSAALPVTGVALPPPPPPPPQVSSSSRPCLVFLGLWCSAGGGRRRRRRRDKTRTALARAAALPSPPLAPGLSHCEFRHREQGGAGRLRWAAMAFLFDADIPSRLARVGFVCLREGSRVCCPTFGKLFRARLI